MKKIAFVFSAFFAACVAGAIEIAEPRNVPPLFPQRDNGYQVKYPAAVAARGRMRGVMGRGVCRNTEQDIEDLKNYGANLIRLQMNGFASRKRKRAVTLADWNEWLERNLVHAEQVLGWLEKRDMQMVLDLHNPPLGGYGRSGDVFYVQEYADRFVEAWREIAKRFKGRKGIYGYDLMNEPSQSRRALPDCDYWNLQRRAAEAIRAIDPDVTIIFAANEANGPQAFAYLAALEMDNVIYQVHMYKPGGFTHQGANGAPRPAPGTERPYPDPARGVDKEKLRTWLKPVVEFQRRHNAKIYVGEFSACIYAPGAGQYLKDCISLFEEYGWDWTYHSFREALWWNVETVIDEATGKPVPNKDNDRFRALIDGFSGTVVAAGFDEARPVWPTGETETLNAFFTFRSEFDAVEGDDVRFRATAGYVYKARLNGAFAAFGPARATPGFFRVDEWRLKPKAGRNVIEIDVAGYNCPNFYLAKQTPFLQAELAVNGKVVAATGGNGFKAFTTGKLRKTPRYAYQRPYSEVYRLPVATAKELSLAVQDARKLLPREWDYPTFGVVEAKPISRERTQRDAATKLRIPRFLEGGRGDFVRFRLAELEDNPYFEMQRRKTVSREKIAASPDGRYALDDGEGVVFALDRVRGGFPGLSVRAEAPTTIYLTYDEILQPDGAVDFLRTDTVATLTWHLATPGDYVLESFEPYGYKHMRVLSVGGRVTVSAPYMRTYESPSAARARFHSSDPALERIFEAAKASYVANAVDCLTDCPNRERGGWLGDTFFTGRASQWLTGTGRNERLFLENFSRAEKFPSPKRYDGLVPAIWPCDLMSRGCFIPTYDMWLIGELGECVARNGDSNLAAAFRPKVDGMLEYFGRYVNDYGLLQHLPGWVFIEWSDANTLVYDVNYPANMLYAWSLDAAAKLYGRNDLADEAQKIRERVRRESFNGKWFCDNAVVKDMVGNLGPSGRCTEVCQYFAFFTETATPQTHPELYKRLMDEFGPNRAEKGLYSEVAPANFLFGTLLRMELLSRAGRSRQIYDELRDYFLYMADRTGTLWENHQPNASCCHGFAAIASEYLFRDMLGVRRVDYIGKRIWVKPPADMPLDWCKGVVPLSEDAVAEIAWRRGQDGRISSDSRLPAGWNVVSTP